MILDYAVACLEATKQLNEKRDVEKLPRLSVRIGVHSGSVVAGIVGSRKWMFDIWVHHIHQVLVLTAHTPATPRASL